MSEGNNAVLSSGIVIVGPLQVLVVGTKCGMIKDCYNYPFNDTTNEVSCSTWCKVLHCTYIIAEIVLILRCNIVSDEGNIQGPDKLAPNYGTSSSIDYILMFLLPTCFSPYNVCAYFISRPFAS